MRSIMAEFADAPLPDPRLQRRLCRIAAAVATQPGATFPKMAASDGELEAIYRFVNNGRVKPDLILEPHQAATWERAQGLHTVVAVHDTSEFENDTQAAEELGYITAGRRGFFGHFSLLLGAQHEPLGIAAMQTLFRPRPRQRRKKDTSGFYTHRKKHREMDRWQTAVDAVEAARPAGTSVVHVMDRGADSYELFANLVAHGRRFVIRLRQIRDRVAASKSDQKEWDTLADVAEAAKYVCQRRVPLSRRRGKSTPRAQYAPRKQRWATLHIEASKLVLRRGRHLPSTELPDELELSLVRVHEVNAPVGEEPVEWWLVTTEPIETASGVEEVVDWYRARWKIETAQTQPTKTRFASHCTAASSSWLVDHDQR